MADHGFPENPQDSNWMEGFCGGKAYQWSPEVGGRCGICGDPWGAEVREHEAPGGRFANGIIVREYQPGQVIPVTSHITANHVGFVDFRLCSNNNTQQDPGQECFDQTVLTITAAGEGSYLSPDDPTKLWIEDVGSGHFSAAVRLPEVECSQCILQWTYWNGRDWGTCNGACGPVETFRACADIAIIGSHQSTASQASTETTTSTGTEAVTEAVTEVVTTTEQSESGGGGEECEATGPWRGQPAMDSWCETNCRHSQPFCPTELCSCSGAGAGAGGDSRVASSPSQCAGLGPWEDSTAVAAWCNNNCLGVNKFCPASLCRCW